MCLREGSAGGEWAHNLQTLEREASPGIMAFCLVVVSPPPPDPSASQVHAWDQP